MKSVAAAKAKSNFGELIDSAVKEPVVITKNERAVAVMVSKEEYERLLAIEDAVWAARAQAALSGGSPLNADESIKALQGLIGA